MAFLPPPPKKYKGTLLICALGLVLLMLAAVFGDHGLVHLVGLQRERGALEHSAFDMQQRNERLREQIERLRSDDTYIEKLARERLGFAKPGEIIYRVTTAPTPPR